MHRFCRSVITKELRTMKTVRYLYIKSILIVITFVIAFTSCKDDEIPAPKIEREEGAIEDVYAIMKEWYLWNDELPDLDLSKYNTPQEVMDALQKKPTDRWSFIEDAETYEQLFDQGKYEGYGVRFVWEDENTLRIALVFEDSPFYEAGVRRGWKVTKINGKAVSSVSSSIEAATNTFELVSPDGKLITETFTKKEISINTVLHSSIISVNSTKVGYLAFNSFLRTSEAELKEVLEKFHTENISEMILDMRYNGGGRANIAEYLASNIIGTAGSGKNFIEFVHNDDKAEYNQSSTFIAPEFPLNLNRLIVIASESTASASELIINGLKPFMDIVIVGNDTHGKPVGSYSFNDREKKYAINPISFAITNDMGEGYYFDGLPADVQVPDDLSRDFGNPEEARLKEALFFIDNGMFSVSGSRFAQPSPTKKSITYNGIYEITGAY